MHKVQSYTVLSAAAATGAGKKIFVEGFGTKEITMSVAGQGSGDVITVKAQGSSAETAPDFGAAATASNEWAYVQLTDLDNGSSTDGSTGITFSNSNTTKKFEVNGKGLKWITLNVTTYTDANASGSITATINLYDNN